MQTKRLAEKYDCLAPDGSEIRVLASTGRGSSVHCTLPAGGVSLAVAHRSVEEIWYFLAGSGEVWRKQGDREEVTEVFPGVSLEIPTGVHFQFRNTGDNPLEFVLTTIPAWPGPEEAFRVSDHWEVPFSSTGNER